MRLLGNQTFQFPRSFVELGLRRDVRVVEKAGYLEKFRQVLEDVA